MKKFYFASLLIVSHSLFARPLTPIAESTCQAAYMDLFSKNEISMTIALGYFDTQSGKTNDLKGLKFYVNTFTKACVKWDQKMCGFEVQSLNPTILTKKIFGPDANIKTLKVIIGASSVGDSDAANRVNPQQATQTESMKALFKNGLENSEITFYHGHSRDGGGPSFGSPVLKADGHVDYEYYHKNKADKKFLLNILAKNPGRSRLVALASCSSLRWFSQDISKFAPASGIIGTTDLFMTRYFEESLVFMENIFSFKCLKDLKVPDGVQGSHLVSGKDFKTSYKMNLFSQTQLDQQTLEVLVTHLSSPDVATRKNAYLEIKSFDPSLYSPRVMRELSNYTFGNTFMGGVSGLGF